MEKIRILIADDHKIIRSGLRFMLKKSVDIKIVADVESGKEAIRYLMGNPNSVDIVLMDINMPVMDGVTATRYITKNFKHINVLAITMLDETNDITKMIEAGALGFILKEAGEEEFAIAIKVVQSGESYYSNGVSVGLINALMNKDNVNKSRLSERQLEVLCTVANGATNKQTGEKLNISARTVETHRKNILEKLKIKNTAEMVKYAINNNLI